MKKMLSMVVVILLFTNISLGESKTKRDGYWWQQWEEETENETVTHLIKLAFVMGYIASSHSIMTFLDSLQLIAPEGDLRKELLSSINVYLFVKYCSEDITYGQFVSGLDEYYKDWKNKHILFPEAFADVLFQARGQSSEEIRSRKKLLMGKSFEERWQGLFTKEISYETIDTVKANRVYKDFSILAVDNNMNAKQLLNYLKAQHPAFKDTTERTEIYKELRNLGIAYSLTPEQLIDSLKAQHRGKAKE